MDKEDSVCVYMYVCIYLYIGILLDHKKERNLHIMLSQRNERKTNIVQFHLHVKSKKNKTKQKKPPKNKNRTNRKQNRLTENKQVVAREGRGWVGDE